MMVKRIRESPQTSSGNSGLGRPEGLDIQGHQTWASVFAPFKGHRKPSNLSRYSPPLGCLSHRIDPWGRTVFSPTFTIKINKINVGVYIYIYIYIDVPAIHGSYYGYSGIVVIFPSIFSGKPSSQDLRNLYIFSGDALEMLRRFSWGREEPRVDTPRWSTMSDLTKFVSPQHFQGKKKRKPHSWSRRCTWKNHHFLVSICLISGGGGYLKMEARGWVMVRIFRSSPFTGLEVSVSRRR